MPSEGCCLALSFGTLSTSGLGRWGSNHRHAIERSGTLVSWSSEHVKCFRLKECLAEANSANWGCGNFIRSPFAFDKATWSPTSLREEMELRELGREPLELRSELYCCFVALSIRKFYIAEPRTSSVGRRRLRRLYSVQLSINFAQLQPSVGFSRLIGASSACTLSRLTKRTRICAEKGVSPDARHWPTQYWGHRVC